MYNLDEIRKQFPMLHNKTMQGKPLVFLDNASTTFKPQCVLDAMNDYYTDYTSNSHRGDYDLCNRVDNEVYKTRVEVASFLNCEVNEVVFTSGDTEALNLIAYGYALNVLKKDDVILLTEVEHASNVLPWYRICELTGAKVKFIELENSKVTLNKVKDAFAQYKNIKIVSLAHIGNVLGYRIDAKEIAKVCHEHGSIFILDGAQSVPHIKTDFKDLDVDFITFSAHKMCGPTGVGCLIGKASLLEQMSNFHLGGGMNVTFSNDMTYIPLEAPAKFEAGTLNLAGIIGFGEAVRFIKSIGIENIEKHEKELFAYVIRRLESIKDIIIYNKDSNSGIIAFNREEVFAQDEATLLNSKGIAVRSGQHCAKMIDNVINTIATVRASFYLYTSKEDVDALINELEKGGDILDAYFSD